MLTGQLALHGAAFVRPQLPQAGLRSSECGWVSSAAQGDPAPFRLQGLAERTSLNTIVRRLLQRYPCVAGAPPGARTGLCLMDR